MIFSRPTPVYVVFVLSICGIRLEIATRLHEKMISVMEQRNQNENQYLDVELPTGIDAIKVFWCDNMHQLKNPDLSVYVPETGPEDL